MRRRTVMANQSVRPPSPVNNRGVSMKQLLRPRTHDVTRVPSLPAPLAIHSYFVQVVLDTPIRRNSFRGSDHHASVLAMSIMSLMSSSETVAAMPILQRLTYATALVHPLRAASNLCIDASDLEPCHAS